MNAIDFITKEHKRIKKSFAKIVKKSHRFSTKQKMFKALCQDLLQHETMEQKVWYPNFKNDRKIKAEVRHLIHEEKSAEHTMKAIKSFKNIKTEKEWDTKLVKFKTAVEKHASEEEKKLFPNVAKILDEKELELIGKKLRQYKIKHKKK